MKEILFQKNISNYDICYNEKFIKKILNNFDLIQLVNSYLTIRPEKIENRIISLEKIFTKMDKENFGKEIVQIKNKINYLQKILFFYKEKILLYKSKNIYDFDFIKHYISKLNDSEFELQNGLYYDKYNNRYSGYYHLEILDPAHRALSLHKLRYDSYDFNMDFFIYLEKYSKDENEKFFCFFNKEELKRNQITIKNNLCFKKNKKLTTLKNNEFLYTINNNYDFFVYNSDHNKNNHITSTFGKPILTGGYLEIEDGIIKIIAPITGHYLIDLEGARNTIKVLNQIDIYLNDNTIIKFYDKGLKKELDIKNFTKFYL